MDKLDLDGFGIDIEENDETEEEEEAEEVTPQPKQEEPKKPKVDHSVPTRQRIEDERSKLDFEKTVMGSWQRQAAKIIGDLILWEFDHHPEREQEWDYNEWTLVDFLKAFASEAQKQVRGSGDQALFAGRTEDENDPTMELVRSIIHRKNEPPKPPKPVEIPKPATPKKTEEKPKVSPKQQKKDHEQLTLDLEGLL